MATRRLGIIMHGVTGRMGTNQHLVRSILAIRADGGVRLADGDVRQAARVGKNPLRLRERARMGPVAAGPGVRNLEKGQVGRESREELCGPRLIVDDEDAGGTRHAAGPSDSAVRTSCHSPRLSW